jgi:hypothetical protein
MDLVDGLSGVFDIFVKKTANGGIWEIGLRQNGWLMLGSAKLQPLNANALAEKATIFVIRKEI